MVKIEWDIKLSFQDVLIRPKRSKMRSRKDVDLNRTFKFLHSNKTWTGIPIVAANMDTTGTFEMAREFAKKKMMVAVHKHYSLEQWHAFMATEEKDNAELFQYIAVSSGTSDKDHSKLCELLKAYPKQLSFVCLDIANGYSEHFAVFISKVRTQFPDHIIMAGNVVTQEMTEQLLLSGADIVKVGIGPGSVCTTRKKTGVGYPQLSAVLECADAAHGLGGLIVSDGGCTMPGDFSKAFGAGADFVMAGGVFSGYEESGGDLIVKGGRKFKQFYGMSSSVAMNKHSGGVKNYRASEGKCVLVPYKGRVMDDCLMGGLGLLGGIRSTCTYVGAKSLRELSKRTTFIRVMHHHNTVFGDEKSNAPSVEADVKGKEDVIQEKEALMSYLTDQGGAKKEKENEEANVGIKSPFDMMTTQMKDEYFEWVKKREAERIRQTANDKK